MSTSCLFKVCAPVIAAGGVSCGYTIVGTGEILWTLGEHYQRTRDKEWLRKIAPDVVHICQWIMRQREKTKQFDVRGEKLPEWGLMPPGVSADWNRFAYRMFNDAQLDPHAGRTTGRAVCYRSGIPCQAQ